MSIRFLTKTYQFSRKEKFTDILFIHYHDKYLSKILEINKIRAYIRETHFTVVYLEVKAFICISDSSKHF